MPVKKKQLTLLGDEAKYVESYIAGEIAKYFLVIENKSIDKDSMDRYIRDSIDKFWQFHAGRIVADASFSDVQCIIIPNANRLALKLMGCK